MERAYKNCQSCGMPLKKDANGGGSNVDGTISKTYCSYCYRNGAFVSPNMTLDEMKALVKGKLMEFGFPGFLAGIFTMRIPKLLRWKNN